MIDQGPERRVLVFGQDEEGATTCTLEGALIASIDRTDPGFSVDHHTRPWGVYYGPGGVHLRTFASHEQALSWVRMMATELAAVGPVR